MNGSQYTEEIMSMMHAFGDSSQPMVESARLIESIVHEQLSTFIERAEDIARIRDSQVVDVEDLLFLMRKDKTKLIRLVNHLYVKDLKQAINEGNQFDIRMSDLAQCQQTRRVKICYEFLGQLGEFGEYRKVFNQALIDEVKNQRMRRLDSLTKNMSAAEYSEFTKARQVSFISKVKPDKFSEWLLARKPDTKMSIFAFEIIQYLAHETVAQIVDMSLLVKQDIERDPNDPLSVLITRSSHNKTDCAGIFNQCTQRQQHQGKSFNIPFSSKVDNYPKCLTPTHIHEAMRRYCSTSGPYREFRIEDKSSPLVILCI